MTLERDLRALADGFPEPPAARPARARGRPAGARRRGAGAGASRLLALALFLLVPATALAVSRDLRDRVLETFGLRDVKVTRVTRLPAVGADVRRLELGPRISLAQARTELRLRVGPPTALGAPDGIFEERCESGVDVTFLYQPRTAASASACASASSSASCAGRSRSSSSARRSPPRRRRRCSTSTASPALL